MGRVNKHAAGLNRERWIAFGKMIEKARGRKALNQKQAAEAVGISRRQWIRYTKGVPVPRERIIDIAKLLEIPVNEALLAVGHEPTETGVDIESYLRSIRDGVLGGKMGQALLHLYLFYQDAHEEARMNTTRSEVWVLTNFRVAVAALNEMPGWLRRELVVYLRGLERGSSKKEFPASPEIKERILAMLREEDS